MGFGYACEAVQELIACLKKEYDVSVVRATSDTRNASSIKLLERLGFQYVARVDAADYFKGQTSNEYIYELWFTSTAYAPNKPTAPERTYLPLSCKSYLRPVSGKVLKT